MSEFDCGCKQLQAAQLHIKELREALQDLLDEGVLKSSIINKALAKQPDTRALDKSLLEAEYRGLNTASWFEWKRRTDEVEAKLAELNKE